MNNIISFKTRKRGFNTGYTQYVNHLIKNVPIEYLPKNMIIPLLNYPTFRLRFNDFIYNKVITEIHKFKNDTRKTNIWTKRLTTT